MSTNGGATWKHARLKDALSPYTWVLWIVNVTMSGDKHYKIVARATDKTGQNQHDTQKGNDNGNPHD